MISARTGGDAASSPPAGDSAGIGPGAGTVYLIHFNTPYKQARHYTGWTTDLPARLQAHQAGRGARLMEVITDAGITWQLARTWPGPRGRERAIKNRHEAPKLCPECSPQPRPVSTGRSAARPGAEPQTAAPQPPRPQADPYERGASMGTHFLAAQRGRTADQIEAAHDYITRPFRSAPRHTAAQAETFRGYTETITGRIAELRDAERKTAARTEPEAEAG